MGANFIFICSVVLLMGLLIDKVHLRSVQKIYQKELDVSCFVHIGSGGRPRVDCKMNKVSQRHMNELQLDVKSKLTEQGGMQSLNIALYNMNAYESEELSDQPQQKVIPQKTKPTKPPKDYEYINGHGYYKFYADQVSKFKEAESRCIKDGAHLLILNSQSEAMAMKYFFNKYPYADRYAFIGFHDMQNTGKYLTIQGQTLASAGYETWGPGEPNNRNGRERCGSLDNLGLLNDLPCDNSICSHECRPRPFICEF